MRVKSLFCLLFCFAAVIFLNGKVSFGDSNTNHGVVHTDNGEKIERATIEIGKGDKPSTIGVIRIGPITTGWMCRYNSKKNTGIMGVDGGAGETDDERGITGYNFLAGDIEDIKDPSDCEYKFADGGIPFNRMAVNQIIILKHNDSYVAIKPIAIERRINPEYRFLPNHDLWIDYEWKYWPKVLPKKPMKLIGKDSPEVEAVESDNGEKTGKATEKMSGKSWSLRIEYKTTNWVYTKDGMMSLGSVSLNSKLNSGFVLLEEKSLETIKNPSALKYEKAPFGNFPHITLGLKSNDILVLKDGESYLAIKFMGVEKRIDPRYKQMVKYNYWISYEWKYWPEAKPIKLAKTAQN